MSPVYRHIPILVTAYRFEKGNFNHVARWCGGTLVWDEGKVYGCSVPMKVKPGVGYLTDKRMARVGDWIVLHPIHGFITMRPDEFAAEYEERV